MRPIKEDGQRRAFAVYAYVAYPLLLTLVAVLRAANSPLWHNYPADWLRRRAAGAGRGREPRDRGGAGVPRPNPATRSPHEFSEASRTARRCRLAVGLGRRRRVQAGEATASVHGLRSPIAFA